MFNSSKALLFRPMPALNKLKIHQPLPLTPRESKQLLNLLTSSFRQHLDTEHGDLKTDAGHKLSTRASTHQDGLRPRRRSFSEPSMNPADRHMNSLLTNPLFNYLSNGNTSRSTRDPLDLFDEAVAKGMMNPKYARMVLNAKKRDIVQSPILNIRDGMGKSGAGLKVLRWLVSSGATNDLEFLKDEQFSTILMEYMVAEGLQEAVWPWIRTSFNGASALFGVQGEQWRQARRDIVRPFMLLVKAEASGPVGLDSAYMCLSRAAGYLQALPTSTIMHILKPPGLLLAHQTIMSNSEHPPPSESNFESFLSLVPSFSKEIDYHFAHLNLLHPTRPSADLALTLLRSMEESPTQKSKMSKERNHIQLGLDTARFLLENDRFDDAEFVMDLLRTKFPKQLGLKQKRQLEQAKAEASSLEILEGLHLA